MSPSIAPVHPTHPGQCFILADYGFLEMYDGGSLRVDGLYVRYKQHPDSYPSPGMMLLEMMPRVWITNSIFQGGGDPTDLSANTGALYAADGAQVYVEGVALPRIQNPIAAFREVPSLL